MKHKFTVNVTQTVEVTLDDEVVNEEFFAAFSDTMWHVDCMEDIAEYIARQKALFDGYQIEFVPKNYSAEITNESVEVAD